MDYGEVFGARLENHLALYRKSSVLKNQLRRFFNTLRTFKSAPCIGGDYFTTVMLVPLLSPSGSLLLAES